MKTKVLNMIIDNSAKRYHFEIGRFNIYETCDHQYYYIDTATDRESVYYSNLLAIVAVIDNIQKGAC